MVVSLVCDVIRQMSVYCADAGTPQLTSERWLNVTVTDVNDNTPRFLNDIYSIDVFENIPPGSSLYHMTATDADTGVNSIIRYSVAAQLDGEQESDIDHLEVLTCFTLYL